MNLSEPYSEWWCCLNPRESTALSILAVSWLANPEYITQTAFTVVAFISGLASVTLVTEYFLQHYGLTSGIVLDEEGNPIPVYFFDTTFWPLFYVFTLTEEFACVEPCANFEFWT